LKPEQTSGLILELQKEEEFLLITPVADVIISRSTVLLGLCAASLHIFSKWIVITIRRVIIIIQRKMSLSSFSVGWFT
jgi:hypothetical protein